MVYHGIPEPLKFNQNDKTNNKTSHSRSELVEVRHRIGWLSDWNYNSYLDCKADGINSTALFLFLYLSIASHIIATTTPAMITPAMKPAEGIKLEGWSVIFSP